MFELETEIAKWRRSMRAAGIRSSATLDELEAHLRDSIEQRKGSAASEARAFAEAVRQIGAGRLLKAEFEKINERKTMKRILLFGAGMIGVLVGMGFVMPALALYRHHGTLPGPDLVLLLLGAALTLGGISAAALGVKKSA